MTDSEIVDILKVKADEGNKNSKEIEVSYSGELGLYRLRAGIGIIWVTKSQIELLSGYLSLIE